MQLEELKAQLKGSVFDISIGDKGRSEPEDDDPVSVERREKVKEAMLHAWTSYEKYAWGRDELQVFFFLLFNFVIYLVLDAIN